MKIPYSLPFTGEEEIEEVAAAIRSKWLSRGARTIEFEAEFARSVDSPFAIGLHSCTAGLYLSLSASGIGPGDEVITTPYTFVSTVNSIIHCGATPVFVDIDPVTLNIDCEKIESRITERTKAIIPVHFAGFPCEMDRIMAIADQYKLFVIEDAAHAVYTKYNAKPVGSIGHLTCFSFYATKNLAMGEGGAVTTADEELAEKIRIRSLHGMSKNAWNRYSEKGSWYYEVEYPGYKYNMTDIQASLGLAQLRKLEQMQFLRKKWADRYTEAFRDREELIVPYDSTEHRHAWHLYVIRLNENRLTITRNEFIDRLREAGVGTSVHFIPVPCHPYYRNLGYKIEDYPESWKAFQSAISLPLYPGLTEEEVDYVIEQVLHITSNHQNFYAD
ncbi:DegT/DnrJ/EryC1/StrS family aminotransferase [Brevibacillus sp. SYSU BS000544]|uniref:DegT/DnrJ/EryC1/StrS family aminotransferase n=1 Tax=Brevibacillus sp. SYSU BS000544 TaxID=3416443 RepID=UPI003CE56008